MVDKETNPLDAIKNAESRSITPGFLQGNSGFLNKVKGQNRGEAASTLGEAEKSATGSSAVSEDSQSGTSRGGWYAGKGQVGKAGKKSKGKMRIKAGPSLTIVCLLLVGMIAIIPNIKNIAIGTLDYGLDKVGLSEMIEVIKDLAGHILSEKQAKGEVPDKIASDLADSGIIIGQVTENGDFVRTNKYLANTENASEIAATGFDYQEHSSEGELSVLYGDKVIDAEDFVLALESDPKMYSDFSSAMTSTISYFFYESDEVLETFEDIGVNRALFSDWTSTGSEQEDEENLQEILNEEFSDSLSAAIAGCDGDDGEEDCPSADFDGKGVINRAIELGGDTDNIVQLLNMAVSAIEPQTAAKVFGVIKETLQRARLNGEGPINALMNLLKRQTSVSYVDAISNKLVTTIKSILETTNFTATISDGGFSKEEAASFGRDQVIIATDTASSSGIDESIANSTLNDGKGSSIMAVIKRIFGSKDEDRIYKSEDSIKRATEEFNAESFTSVYGGNKAIEGGSYLSTAIAQHALGAMPSDAEVIGEYQHKVNELLARKANAERASLSPFDTSSPNTFLGSIVNRVAIASLNHSSGNNSGFMSAVSTIADLTSSSTDSLLGDAMADGGGQNYTSVLGYCTTPHGAYEAEGDIYCTDLRPFVMKYSSYTLEDFKNALPGQIDDNGNIISDNKEDPISLANYLTLGTNREATVGVKSASVCESFDGDSIASAIGKFFGIYQACSGTPQDVATGAAYVISDKNPNKAKVELFVAYAQYDQVNSLIEMEQSKVSQFKEEYYAKHPKDNSVAGRIARYSGMTKAEAEIAIGYASYLAKLRNYDPSQRYAFNKIDLNIETPPLIVDDTEIKETIYCYWQSKIEFSDLRNRNQVA